MIPMRNRATKQFKVQSMPTLCATQSSRAVRTKSRRRIALARSGSDVPNSLEAFLTPTHVVWTTLNQRASPKRRSSTNIAAVRRPRLQTVVSAQICTEWGYDILNLESVTKNRALEIICEAVFKHFSFGTSVGDAGVNSEAWMRLVRRIAVTYEGDEARPNAYHNCTHAADVVQTVSALCSQHKFQTTFHTQDVWVLCVSAMMHDYQHMGVTNAFLANTKDPIALMFSDDSILERYHLYTFFTVLESGSDVDIFQGFGSDERAYFRFTIIQLVLSTDLAFSGEIHATYSDALESYEQTGSVDTSDIRLVLMQMVLKCADVSHAAKPLKLHYEWSRRVTSEFFAQGEREKEAGVPLTAICQRASVNVADSQCGFIDYVVRKPFEMLKRFSGDTPISCRSSAHIEANSQFWSRSFAPMGVFPPLEPTLVSAAASRSSSARVR